MKVPSLTELESRLEQSAWGRGIYTQRFQVPAARPAQIRAGARKLRSQLAAYLKSNRLHAFRMALANASGQDLVEYSLLVAMIAFAVVLSVKSVGIELAHGFDQISSDLASSL